MEEMRRQQARKNGEVMGRQAVVAALLLGRKKAGGNIPLQIKKDPRMWSCADFPQHENMLFTYLCT